MIQYHVIYHYFHLGQSIFHNLMPRKFKEIDY